MHWTMLISELAAMADADLGREVRASLSRYGKRAALLSRYGKRAAFR